MTKSRKWEPFQRYRRGQNNPARDETQILHDDREQLIAELTALLRFHNGGGSTPARLTYYDGLVQAFDTTPKDERILKRLHLAMTERFEKAQFTRLVCYTLQTYDYAAPPAR